MIVKKEDIQKAKEKLGDENAFLIAEIQGLQEFDEKNLKSLCPHHAEDTPSYIYDKKRHRFKCFGCGYSADLIDARIEKGDTFLQACQYLFDKAKVDYSFGEMNVRTKAAYRYPKLEPLNDRANVIKYLEKRKISKAVVDYLDIREDADGNCVFNYYDQNDTLTTVKYRPSKSVNKADGGIKAWAQKDADTTPLLFNMNRVNSGKPLLIAEGEIDAASVIEAGYQNAVSVPYGANNYGWIEENWDWLEQFDSIIIWSDNDEPGEKMRKECIFRLGAWRTKYIVAPSNYQLKSGRIIKLKDANECLQVGGKELVMKLINEAKDVPVKSVIDFYDAEDIDPSEIDGIKTGIKPLDEDLMKIFYGTLTILSGRPGSGKTSIADQIVANCLDNDKPVFLYSKEMPSWLTANWMLSILAGRRNMIPNEKGYYVVDPKAKGNIKYFYRNKLQIYRDDESIDIDDVMHSAEECVRKYGAKLVILDNLMMLDLHSSESEMNTKQTGFINRLIHFAEKFGCAVILIAHPKKTQDMHSDIDMYDIAGSSTIINLAHRSIGLRRVSDAQKEDPRYKWHKYDVVMTIIKDRMFGKAGKQIGLWYDNISRRFYTDYDEYAYQYKWDKKKYQQPLEYVDRSIEEEFPDK